MNRDQTNGTGAKLLLAALSAALVIGLAGALTTEGFSQETLVARSEDGRTAWAVGRAHHAALTEIWLADRDGKPRRVRAFPGLPGGLTWEGERLCYADEGLKLPMLRGRHEGDVVIVPGQWWRISLDGGEETPEAQAKGEGGKDREKTESSSLSPFPLTLAGEGGGADVQRALDALWGGLNIAMAAYNAAQGGDFKGASVSYERAANWFEKMPPEIRKVGMSKAVCRYYAQALRGRSKADGQALGRGICADHLTAIGSFLTRYAAADSGRYPGDLTGLKAWMERQRIPAWSLFRAPVDADTGQTISYGYRMPRPGDPQGTPVVWSYSYAGRGVELVRSGDRFEVIDRPFGQAQTDSLLALGLRALDRDSTAVAVQALKAVTGTAPSWAVGHSKLGYAYLKAGDIPRAEAAFQKAIELDRGLADAHNGRGLISVRRPMGLQAAIECFQEALRCDPRHAEARYHIAEIRMKLKQPDARGEAEKAIAADSTYAPAYRLIGEWYEVMKDDYQNAALWYLRYLSMKPDDAEARLRLGKAYLMARDFEGTTRLLMDYVQGHPKDVHALPALAQACLEMRRLDRAQTFFERYLEGAGPQERALYEDIRPIAFPEEMAEVEATDGKRVVTDEEKKRQREGFLRRFWAGRDPDLITPVNERLLEHYRRVTYSRQHFSAGKKPWDRRGEAYIRFGEPDYRTRSDAVRLYQGPEVKQVRDRMVEDIYGGKAQAPVIQPGRPVWPVGEASWESWVYTKVDGGVEVTFTDEAGVGNFGFAPLREAPVPVGRMNRFLYHLPQKRYERAAAVAADSYAPRADAPPLKFSYDVADFRGTQQGRTTLEVTYGFPRLMGRHFPEQDSTRLRVERHAALLNLETGVVHRTQGEAVFEGTGDLTREEGVIPDIARLEVPPGKYRLEVSARDRLSGRMGVYRLDVEVANYERGRLRLSGLELARQVGEGKEGDRFTRHGMRVSPLPTQALRSGQSVFIYYEVYNLRPDASGLTNHSVECSVWVGANKVLSKLLPGFVGRGPGAQDAERRAVELDLKGLSPGKALLRVTVKDLNSGEAVARALPITVVE